MSEHIAAIHWKRTSSDFRHDSYNRAHEWSFDAGVTLPASAAPGYRGDPDRVDPEEAFVAALSACHMLTFLAMAARRGFVVDSYDDRASGALTSSAEGKPWMSKVTLRPSVRFADEKAPTAEQLEQLHASAHANCFIALSVKTEVVVETT